MNVLKFVSNIDPKKIEELYPPEDLFKKYQSAMELAETIIGSINPGEFDPSLVKELENATDRLSEVYEYLSNKTELGSKARLNEAVMLAEYKYVERSIYLAGLAKEKEIKEPYRTQISVLPANACLFRYRQASTIKEWIKDNIHAEPSGKVGINLKQMESSYLQQMHYFSTLAFKDNAGHVLARYQKMLSSLLIGFALEQQGKESSAKAFYAAAVTLVKGMEEPNNSSHYMQLQYMKMNFNEFSSFKRLSAKFKDITDRLKFLCEKAVSLLEKGEFNKPKEYFGFTPYITAGSRVASVTGIVCLVGAITGASLVDMSNALDEIWNSAQSFIPSLEAADIPIIDRIMSTEELAHTGGFANSIAHYDSGIDATTLAFAHTGGFA